MCHIEKLLLCHPSLKILILLVFPECTSSTVPLELVKHLLSLKGELVEVIAAFGAGSFNQEPHTDEFIVIFGTFALILVKSQAVLLIWFEFPSCILILVMNKELSAIEFIFAFPFSPSLEN